MVTDELKKIFPKLEFTSELNDLEDKAEKLLLEASEKYGLDYYEDIGQLKWTSEDGSLLVRHDTNEKLEIVFEAQYITYCPTITITSGYHSSVSKALKALAKLI